LESPIRLEDMAYKSHPPAGLSLLGYDPAAELCEDHLARLIDAVVDGVEAPAKFSGGRPGYDPRMLAKLLLFAYSTGTFSSRRMVQNCHEHLAYLFLSRGERPCFRTICGFRTDYKEFLERVWLALLPTAAGEGIRFSGKIAVDASRFKANASGDLVVSEKDYAALRSRLEELLERAVETDAREDQDGQAVQTHTGVAASRVTVRTVVRSLDRDAPSGPITFHGKRRMEECLAVLDQASKDGLGYVSLSDPDARMMPIGSGRAISMGHALEVAVDSGAVVAGSSTNVATDTGRLLPLADQARVHDPVEVTEVVADSAYFQADDILSLQDDGIDVVVPDATTVGLMRGKGDWARVQFEPVEGKDAYRCPEGTILARHGHGKDGRPIYRATRDCMGCPLAALCLSRPTTKRRTMRIRPHADRILPYLASFQEPKRRRQYYARGPGVETVFAVIRKLIGFVQWSVRGSAKIAAEAELLKCAYQARKIHTMILRRTQQAA
jgi:transposase